MYILDQQLTVVLLKSWLLLRDTLNIYNGPAPPSPSKKKKKKKQWIAHPKPPML